MNITTFNRTVLPSGSWHGQKLAKAGFVSQIEDTTLENDILMVIEFPGHFNYYLDIVLSVA